jgi:hypothetical protein
MKKEIVIGDLIPKASGRCIVLIECELITFSS